MMPYEHENTERDDRRFDGDDRRPRDADRLARAQPGERAQRGEGGVGGGAGAAAGAGAPARGAAATAVRDRADPGRPGGASVAREPHPADRWVDEQMFEEDVRAVLKMLRPNRRERLLGWNEYRTGGAAFRATISWASDFEQRPGETEIWHVPRLAEVLETILVGSLRNPDELSVGEEFALYRAVAEELIDRLRELEGCYT